MFLPMIFATHAILNIASISDVITDVKASKFKGQNFAVQQFNFSVLICAGLFLAWGMIHGVQSLNCAMCRNSGRMWARRTLANETSLAGILTPFRINVGGALSVMIALILPLPWIALSTVSVQNMNNLTSELLKVVDQVLDDGVIVDESVDMALQKIQDLDGAAEELFGCIRSVARVHLFLTCWTMFVTLLAYLTVRQTLRPSTDPPGRTCQSNPAITSTCHSLSYLSESADLTSPEPVLITSSNMVISKLQSDETDNQVDPTFEGIKKPFSIEGAEPLIDHPRSSSRRYLWRVKWYVLLNSLVGLSFFVLNICLVTNAFKYPNHISIGEIMIMVIKWSSWSWSGSVSCLVAAAGFIVTVQSKQ